MVLQDQRIKTNSLIWRKVRLYRFKSKGLHVTERVNIPNSDKAFTVTLLNFILHIIQSTSIQDKFKYSNL